MDQHRRDQRNEYPRDSRSSERPYSRSPPRSPSYHRDRNSQVRFTEKIFNRKGSRRKEEYSTKEFIYSAKSKDKWKKFKDILNHRMMQAAISDIASEDRIARIKYRPRIPPAEVADQSIADPQVRERDLARRQKIADDDHQTAKKKQDSQMETLDNNFTAGIALIMTMVDDQIGQDLAATISSGTIAGTLTTPEDKYRATMRKLETTWGPHTQLHVGIIRKQLEELDGDRSWSNYLSRFQHLTGTLEETPQRDATGSVVRGPTPQPALPALPNGATATFQELQEYVLRVQAATALNNIMHPNGGQELNHKPSDDALRGILLNALGRSELSEFKALNKSYLLTENSGKTIQQLLSNVKDLADARESARYGSGIYATGYSSDSSYQHQRSSRRSHERGQARDRYGNHLGRQRSTSRSRERNNLEGYSHTRSQQPQKNTHSSPTIVITHQYATQTTSNTGTTPCANCQKTTHPTRQCDSLTCGTCGKTFASTELRRQHYIEDHRRPQGKSTGSPNNRQDRNSNTFNYQPSPRKENRSPSPYPYKQRHTASSGEDSGYYHPDGNSETDLSS